MTEIAPDPILQDIAAVFRCHPSMAGAIADRIRERLGQPVSNADILRAMKAIPPTRLSVDTVVTRLEKQAPGKTRQAPAAPKSERGRRAGGPAAPTTAAAPEATLRGQLEALLADNWKRAAAESLSPPDMNVDEFIKAVRGYTGYQDAPVRRILQAALALDREDVLLGAHVVADRVNELATREA